LSCNIRNEKILLIVLAIVCTEDLQGQTEFGLKVGVNSSSYNYGDSKASSEAESIRSFNLAGYLDAFIGQGIYLHPEVSLQGKVAKIVKYAELEGGEVIQRVNWLDFAFNLLSKMPVGNLGEFFGGGGPYMGLL